MTNLQGDVTGILDSNGNRIVTYTYDAWGNILSISGTHANTIGQYNPLRYRGYVYDSETGLYYLQSRYYDPAIGRFLNADALASTGQGLLGNNMFAYCGNDPVNRKDISGNWWRYIIEEVETEIVEESDGSTRYRTTITYSARYEPDFGCTLEDAKVWVYEVPFEYTVSKDGLINFDNKQLAATHLEVGQVRDILAEEMFTVSKSKNSNNLQNRTVAGLSAELHIHFLVNHHRIPLFYERSHVTDMGSVKKSSRAYDWNAWMFEVVFGWLDVFK